MPIYNDAKQTMSAIQFLNAFQIPPKELVETGPNINTIPE